MSELEGKRVLVFWTDKSYNAGSDWPSFTVLAETDEGYLLQGVASPDGVPHDGSKVFVKHREIRDIIEWKEGA